MHPQGGYKTVTVQQVGTLLAAFEARTITLRALRLYFAALAAVAAREAAERVRRGRRRRPITSQFGTAELGRLCRIPEPSVRRDLKSLERAGLLTFRDTSIEIVRNDAQDISCMAIGGGRSPLRPVPLPRPALRYLARCRKAATIKTMLAYCVRGLSLTRQGEVKGRGTAKAAWIAQAFGLSLRAVRLARAELIAGGFITPDSGSKQWKLNRDGAYFTVNLAFGGRTEAAEPVDNSADQEPRIARPSPKNCRRFAPPYKDLKTPYGLKDQHTRAREPAGVWQRSSGGIQDHQPPNFHRISTGDLVDSQRLMGLYRQAVAKRLVVASQASRLAFFGAAEHARRVGRQNPCGLFRTIVERGLWHYITHEAEAAARLRLQQGDEAEIGPTPPATESTPLRELLAVVTSALSGGGRPQQPMAATAQPIARQRLASCIASAV